MDKRAIIQEAIGQMQASGTIKDPQYEVVSDANNLVSRVEDKYLKIYTPGNSTIQDNELALMRVTKNPELYKKMLHDGRLSQQNGGFDYALFEAIHGKTLDEVNYTPEQAAGIAKTVYDHIQDTRQIPSTGFGDINANFEGAYDNFPEYIWDLQHKTSTTLFMEPSTRKYSKLSYNLLADNADILKVEKPSIVPVDLNFKNIMVTNDGATKIIDPGALISAPPEMAYAEMMAWGEGTPLYEEFKKHMGGADERLTRLLSTLTLSNVLAFITKHKITEPHLAKPFGSERTFFEAIDYNAEKLRKPIVGTGIKGMNFAKEDELTK